jgi:hypothetical protein
MTSIQGTDSGYSAISGIYLKLAPECSDTIFGTDINYCQLVEDGTKKNGFLKGRFVDGQENDPEIIAKYQQLKENFNKKLTSQIQLKPKAPSTVYDLLHIIPNVSEMLKLVDMAEYGEYLQTPSYLPITFIAPINSALSNATSTWLKTKSKGILKSLLKAHTLDYILVPKTIENRLLRIYTKNQSFYFTADGTGKFKNYINFYQEPTVMLNYQYNLPYDRFKVVATYVTDNGILYLIDGIFSPQMILYNSSF